MPTDTKALVQGTDYSYELNNKYLRVSIKRIEETAMIEIYLANRIIYYAPLREENYKDVLDGDLIHNVINNMKQDKERWLSIEECIWVSSHFYEMSFIDRKTSYRFIFEEAPISVLILEDKDKHMKLHVSNDMGRGRITCDFDVSLGEDVILAAKDYATNLVRIANIFEYNRPEIVKSTLERNLLSPT